MKKSVLILILCLVLLVIPVCASHGISPAALGGTGDSGSPYIIQNGVWYTLYFYKEITWSIYGDTLPAHCGIDGGYGQSGRYSNPGTVGFRLYSAEPPFDSAYVHEQGGWEYIYVTNTIPPTITFQSDGSYTNCNWTHLQVNYNNMGSYVKSDIDIHVTKGGNDYWTVHGSTYATTSETVIYFEETGNYAINYAVTYNGVVYSGSSSFTINNCPGSNWTGENTTLSRPTVSVTQFGIPGTGASPIGNQPWEPGRYPTSTGGVVNYGVNPGSPWTGTGVSPGQMWTGIGTGSGTNYSFAPVGFNTSYTLIDNFLNTYVTNGALPNLPPNLSYSEDVFPNQTQYKEYFNESLIPDEVTGQYFSLVDGIFDTLQSIITTLFAIPLGFINILVDIIVGGLDGFANAVDSLLFFIEPFVMILRIIMIIIPPPLMAVALLALAIDFVRLILAS